MALQRTSVWGLLILLSFALLTACSNGSGSVADGSGSGSSPPPTGGSGSDDSSFTVSVTVSGLVGDGLVLQNNGADDIPVAANGRLTFGQPIANGGGYNVTILSQPTVPAQNCSVVGGVGTISNDDVTNVTVTCTTPDAQSFAVGGTVSGLAGSGLVLQNNAGDDLAVSNNGEFSFATLLATGSSYDVSVLTQPANPAQICSVNSNAGTVGTDNVTNVAVTCSATSFSVSFNVSGLRGSGLQLRLNGSETLSAAANGTYTFTQLVADGAPYSVTVVTQPTNPKQTCVVSNASDIIRQANVTNVGVTCTTDQSIGGTVKGLSGRGLVLRLNGANDLTINSSGPFQFSTVLPRGSQYTVTVATQPSNPLQECTLQNATGVVGSASVSNIGVTCRTRQFKLSANVSGLQGSGFRLRAEWGRNSRQDVDIAGNGTVDLVAALNSGSSYTVSVHRAPNKPRQVCTIANPTGTITNDNVTINVSCAAPTEFAIGGNISGLQGQGLQLQNNGADTLSINAGATSFEFPTYIAVGGSYNVAVVAQPNSPTQSCVVNGGAGSVSNADITSVGVSCTTSSFSVGGSVSGLFLFSTGLQVQINGGEVITVQWFSPTFTFAPLLSGTPYNVAIVAQPPGRTCTIANASGTIGGANITDVAVTCN